MFDNFLRYFMPAITIFTIWCLFTLITMICSVFCIPSREWVKIYEVPRNQVKYRYVVRLITGEMRRDYNVMKSSFRMEIIGPNNERLSAFGIRPHIMERGISIVENGNKNMVKFLILRKTPLNIVKVVLNHNSRGSIYVYSVEIQEIRSEVANIAFVDHYIEKLSERTARIKQAFPSASQEPRVMDYSDEPPKVLVFCEFVIFLWLTINLIPLFSVLLILCFEGREVADGKETKSFVIYCKSYGNSFISCVMTAMMASTLTVSLNTSLITIFRFGIKEKVKSMYFNIMRYFYLTIILMMGSISGLVCVALAIIRFERNAEQESLFWIITICFGYFLFALIWLPILVLIGGQIGFFVIEEKENAVLSEEASKPYIASDGGPPDDKGGPKNGVPAKGGTDKSKAQSKAPKPVTTKGSKESIGNQYYAELMKDKNKRIKSISKY